MEEWLVIGKFPTYSVSTHGRVRNDLTGRLMTQRMNQRGHLYVGLMLDRLQYKRSVAVLVANGFVTPQNDIFDTPIHLDGDSTNNHYSNLEWRPRWFALKYCLQFRTNELQGFDSPIEDMLSGEQFPTSWDAAIKYGLLDYEIKMAILNNTYVWPTFQRFRKV